MIISVTTYRLFFAVWTLMFVSVPTLLSRSRSVASIPFEMAGSYIIIKAEINNSAPVNLVFDTGVKSTFITELHPEDDVELNLTGKKSIYGLGQGNYVSSFVGDNNNIKIGKLHFVNQTVYLIEEDILGLSQYSGLKINGLTGIDLIKDYIAEINYTRRKIYFYQHEKFQLPKGYIYKPLIIEENKIYLNLTLLDDNAKICTIKMLLDTGAMLNAWFQTVRSNAAEIPEKRVYARIGEGFGGELYGYLARIPQVCFEHYCFHNPVVVFPDSAMIADIMRNSDRDGTIGNELLSRFNCIIDMKNKALYLKPNYFFSNKFVYNVAGVEVIQPSLDFPIYEVTCVWKDSPAAKAGLQKGDILTEINGAKTFTMKLTEVRGCFQRVSERPLNIIVTRNQQQMTFNIDMQDLLNNP
ncbi:MAG: aspartyl protease family protein [Paludibacter sp.]|nr:aspartyl protease family protein [Paludibacter sp.]MDD4197845.1 aspartyl protease family protein [Paludibacter sp.]MDD4427888.1 aspartyl protease family protein [Paludibacter sp.]